MKLPTVHTPSLAIHDSSARFPVRRIYCVGQNYAEHAREMGNDPDRQEPFFFSKPADAVVPTGTVIPFPTRTQDLHHEVELVIALGAGGCDIPVEEAEQRIFGCAVGVDLTRRDLQAVAKKAGRPWDMAKGFDQSAPIGTLVPGPVPRDGAIALAVNGSPRQSGRLSDMIWAPAEIVAILSTYVELAPGDLIFTGTPSGVAPLNRGDAVEAVVEGLPPLTFKLV
ncbi:MULTISPECIES: fumarylacetoacetate hydrolase family protein [Sphingomonas]|uniref:fumarylacetoacetate hydrolase family protein n=1 Tax=Sphingomonas TaxID=13687 RepID=UPI000F7F690C|nr:fumarylacetoacetate hydrolase family protein [Sphingomonas sp. ABOLF]RSV13680.1 FAA hydrolase family protein [Sphingomonas sp. ABOLF]GLK20451.1 fumarylacetoacetate hydrolase [Microbacterium terregens]